MTFKVLSNQSDSVIIIYDSIYKKLLLFLSSFSVLFTISK